MQKEIWGKIICGRNEGSPTSDPQGELGGLGGFITH